jgi:hypothetical protein
VGTTVVWINQDRAPHNAVADDGQTFRSDLLRAGQTFSMVASHVGVFSYYCELHGSPGGVGMSAVLRVVSADQAPSVAAPAQAPTAVRPAATARTAAPGVGELVSDGPGLPVRQGYVDGLRSETEELERQTRLLVAAEATGDPAGVRRKAEHIFNLVAGAADPQFGDLDRDGRVQNAGDGYGLLPNGDQAGYIQAVRTAAETVARSAEQPRSRQDDAAAVRTAAENVQLWATEARAVSLALTRATDLRSTARPIGRLVTLARWMALGNDANADNQLSAVPGEGGARVAYDYAHHLVEASQSTR